MAFKTIVKTVIAFLIPIAALFATASTPSPTYKIGIIQTIEHPALDETRKGIRDELTEQGYKDNLEFEWDSCQFNQSLATQIAQKYVGKEVNIIIGLGTMGAQAALSAAVDTKIPVVFSSVTDPKTAKLKGNVAGVSNFIPVKEHFDLIQQILPSKKRIGVIYNTGDPNSVTLVELMQKIAKERGLELVLATVTKTSEVPTAAQSLVEKVDAILINNDNTALAAFDGIGRICLKSKIPLFASDADVLDKGALAVKGPDQYDLGRQTGRMLVKILKGEAKASDLGTQYPEKIGVYLNEPLAKKLNIILPDSLKKEAIHSGGEAL